METAYVNYLGVRVTIEKDTHAFADFNNNGEIREAVDDVFSDLTQRELVSDGTRYRVYMHKQELGKLFTGIEKVYEMTNKQA
ncbi:MAG: hypothetical protein K6G24_01630 [Lachnospiraceae bacterium]|nr:hypothetical protein [Lachnospiraceae bacterium]